MKKTFNRVLSASLGAVLAMGIGFAFGGQKEDIKPVQSYSTNASTYYSGITAGITATSGKELAGQLHDLITSTHQTYTSYDDNGKNGKQKITDRYYENGVAQSGYIYEFYSGVKWPDGWYPDSGDTRGGYNREHCWCQSNSVNTSGTQMWGESGGGADMHHLRPVESRLNSTRGNNKYGEISSRDSHKVYAKYGTNATYALGGYNNGGVFEPLDSKKGDVARIILYTYLHYNSKSVTSLFGGYAKTDGNGSSSYFSTTLLSLTKITNQTTEAKAQELLLSWNASDPVDDIETRRNEQVATIQGNRNPFIDNSQYADMIWGDGPSPSTPIVSSVTVSPETLNLDLDGTTTGTLTANVVVLNGAPTTVTWSSTNENVATVSSSGVVTAVAKGSCNIIATSTYNENKSDSCTVKVTDSSGGGGETEEDATMTPGTNGSACTVNVNDNDNDGIKIGTSKAGGDMTITVGAGATKLVLYAAAWNAVNGLSLNITGATVSPSSISLTADSGVSNNSPFTLVGDEEDYIFEITLSNIAEETTLTFTTSSSKRCVVWGAKYEIEVAPPSLTDISLNTSNVQTEFTLGDTFDYSGLIVTAYYDNETEDIVEPTSVSSPNMMTVGEKEITVTYTEGEVTKSKPYTITVVYADVESVQIDVHAASIILNQSYTVTCVSVTVLPATAVQTTEWVVSANTVSDDYTWNGTTLTSGSTAGSITLRCQSTTDNSKYDELVVTVTGDPVAAFSIRSYTGYVSEDSVRIDFTYGNIAQGKILNRFKAASSDGSIAFLRGTRFDEINKTGYIQVELWAPGNVTLTLSYDGVVLDSIPLTSLANNVEEVNWSASNIDVFSGVTLTSDIDSTWNVNYRMSNGDTGNLSYGEYTLKLGGNSITLPHTWVAEDDGKTLCVEYGGTSSSTVSVTVTQTINSVYAPVMVPHTVSWTATAASDLGSAISSQGGTDKGTVSTGDYSWDYTRTLTSLGDGKSDYIAFQGSTWIQLGSGNAMESLEFKTSSIPGTIKSVAVVAATAGSHVLTIDVGGTKYFDGESLQSYSNTVSATNPNPANCIKTGTGSSSGAITITIAPTASTKKAMVIRSISVTYETPSGSTVDIANNPEHKEAQRVAVKFANAFNDAMDDTEYCTAGLDDAWSACASAYSTFLSDCAALELAHEGEGEYAKNLVRYATAQYSDDSGEACIERAMKTYEVCISKHHLDPFMYDDDGTTPLRSINVSEGLKLFNVQNSSTILIVSVVSLVSVAAVGGYFFLRKKKED